MESVRLFLALAAHHGWKLYHMDFETALLNGILQEQVYIQQPRGYEVSGQEHRVLKLKRALYGLKQAPRTWNTTLDVYLHEQGFARCPHEYALYVKRVNHDLMLICIYVDDLLLMGNKLKLLDDFKQSLVMRFEMTDLGVMSHYLGLQVQQKEEGIFVTQKHYIEHILNEVGLSHSKPVNTPLAVGSVFCKANSSAHFTDSAVYRSVVGSLRYITCTRPDIMHAVGMVSRYMQQPTVEQWAACKRILRYLKGTKSYGLWFPRAGSCFPTSDTAYSAISTTVDDVLNIVGYCDSDWAGDVDERKSTTGFVFMVGSTAISWASKKQPIVALSSSEAEYVAAATCVSHALWLLKLLAELKIKQEGPMIIHVDNQSAIAIAKNPVYHDRSKHIDVRFHFLRDAIAKKEVELKFVRTQAQIADVMTKALSYATFSRCRRMLGVVPSQD
ncbi:hypothetical protein Dimus_039621 [Dionaea muscipula]